MISDQKLMKISFILAIIGITCLLILNLLIQPEELSIKDITISHVGHEIAVSGLIKSITTKDSHIFITLSDNNADIKTVIFANIAKNYPYAYNLTTGDSLRLQGKVENYKGELEIIANKIEIR